MGLGVGERKLALGSKLVGGRSMAGCNTPSSFKLASSPEPTAGKVGLFDFSERKSNTSLGTRLHLNRNVFSF